MKVKHSQTSYCDQRNFPKPKNDLYAILKKFNKCDQKESQHLVIYQHNKQRFAFIQAIAVHFMNAIITGNNKHEVNHTYVL